MNTRYFLPFLFLSTIGILFGAALTHAQTPPPTIRTPVADNTLGTQVSGDNNNFTITGGLNRGQNLFHSFQDFSVPTGGAATFINPAGNRSIITRVTGGNFSDIDGLVNTQGANFFLINPNGIVFGANARLDVGQTFVGSTANGIDLVDAGGNSYRFGTNGNDAPLLTINPNALLTPARLIMGVNRPNSPGIVNYGTIAPQNDSQYIGLIGGNVTLDGRYGGGKIVAPGGRVDLGGLNTAGTISVNNNGLVFGDNGLSWSDVSLTNGAYVTVRANQTLETVNTFFNNSTSPGSSINISANNLKILDSGGRSSTEFAAIDAGLQTDSGVKTTTGGDININATGRINLSSSDIKNTIRTGAEGKIGDININANSLTIFGTNNPLLLQGNDITALAQISSVSAGQGDAGKITIDVKDKLSLDGRGVISSAISSTGIGNSKGIKINAGELTLSNFSTIESSISQTAKVNDKGNGGNIDISAGNLFVTNGARLSASTFGQGGAGSVKITATGNIFFDNAYVFSTVEQGAVGKGGGIEINARNLSITNGAQLQASTFGQGNAGSVKVLATGDVSFDGVQDGFSSAALSQIEPGAVGKGGGVEINARNLYVTNGAALTASTKGEGDAGSVKITATGDVSFNGRKDGFSSAALSNVEQGGVGKGGGVEINARNLYVTNGAGLTTSTRGDGDAGNIKITATGDVSFDGRKDGFSSAALSQVEQLEQRAVGKGGGIEINARNLAVTNGAALTTSTQAKGDAGSIRINATGDVFFDGSKDGFGSGAFSQVGQGAVGKGGGIEVNSRNLAVTNGARLQTSSVGQGDGGNIVLNDNQIFLNKGLIVLASTNSTGGDLKITTKEYLLLRNSSVIFASSLSTEKNSNGGNITINTPFIITAPNENSDIFANGFGGSGGQITINTKQNFWISPLSRTELGKRLGTTAPNQLNPLSLPTNDITAISQGSPNLDGQITITPPEIDITAGLSPLPNNITDPTNQINPNCSPKAIGNNSFTSIGRGGIPRTPFAPLNEEQITSSWVKLNPQDNQPSTPVATLPAQPKPIVEAQGWRRDSNGDILLVVQSSSDTSFPQPQPASGCVAR